MRLSSKARLVLGGTTLLPPVLLWLAGQPIAALVLLLVLQLPLVFGTLNPHSTLFGPVLRKLPTDAPEVWLTIDDGPSDDTLALLELLDLHRSKATFFLVADRARLRPDLVQAIRQRGHEIGNHSTTHPAGRFWSLSPGRIANEISTAQRTLASLSGIPPRWFRAVVGHANPFVAPALVQQGLTRVSWTARGYDAVTGDVDRVIASVLKDVSPGAIILLHEGAAHGHSVAIVRGVIEAVLARGLRLVLPP